MDVCCRPGADVYTSLVQQPFSGIACPYEDYMTLISDLVERHQHIFVSAVRSTPEALRVVEESLNVKLPNDLIWFMTTCGAASTGVVSNERAIVADTMRYREATSLPNHFVVLDERSDAGTVFLNTSSERGAVAWVDSHAIHSFALGTIQSTEYDAYPSFCEWVADCITETED
jgi:hypothetical protein